VKKSSGRAQCPISAHRRTVVPNSSDQTSLERIENGLGWVSGTGACLPRRLSLPLYGVWLGQQVRCGRGSACGGGHPTRSRSLPMRRTSAYACLRRRPHLAPHTPAGRSAAVVSCSGPKQQVLRTCLTPSLRRV